MYKLRRQKFINVRIMLPKKEQLLQHSYFKLMMSFGKALI